MQAWLTKLSVSWLFLASLLVASAGAQASTGRTGTIVNSRTGYAQLIGRHKFQLHWISWGNWQKFGDLTVTNRDGLLVVNGRYSDDQTGDFIEIDGVVTRVEERSFDFEGTIVTRVSHINNGDPCTREGAMTFAIKGKRRYWRLQQMQNPCDAATDYVDIFLR
ncbi:MAG: hypothetical protein NZ585_03125 [Chloracidobacterium sp.]|nr:hypothetical protein [Chloracidobacterium sp.]MDW8217262.1 hypothetical protein [Acidobacteriota bacterium]